VIPTSIAEQLSPAAQAVFDAFCCEARSEPHHQREAIAAALQAVANRTARVVPPRQSVEYGSYLFWREGYVEGVIFFRDELLAIATQLKAQ